MSEPQGPVAEAERIANAILAWCSDERAEPVILGSISLRLSKLCADWWK